MMEPTSEITVAKGKRKKIFVLVAVLLLAALVVLVFIRASGAKKKGNMPVEEKQVSVEVTAVSCRSLGEELSVAGTVTPAREAKICPKVMGRVSLIGANIGQRVKQGQVLLAVEQTDYITALRQAEANLAAAEASSIQAQSAYENAKLNLQRTEDLFKQGAVSQSVLETAQNALATAESGYLANQAQISQCQVLLDKARTDLSNTEVTAPFAGVVAKRLTDIGETVSQSTPVFLLIQDNPLLVKVNMPENMVTKISLGQKVDIHVGATGKTYVGTISAVSPQADSLTKAYAVEVTLDKVSGEVRAGMVADLIVKTNQIENALVVPTDALLETDNGVTAFIVENDTAIQRKVTAGMAGQGFTQILSGLEQGDMVVVRGNHLLVDGMKVRAEVYNSEIAAPSGEVAR